MKKNNNVLLLIQFVLCMSLLIVMFMNIFISELFILVKIVMILLLLDMALNNHIIYKRKKFTTIYLLFAVIFGVFA